MGIIPEKGIVFDQSNGGGGGGEETVEEKYEALVSDLQEGKTISIPLEGDFVLEMTPVREPTPESGGMPLVHARVIQVHAESSAAHPEQALRWQSGFFERGQ